MATNISARLAEPFAPDLLKQVSKGGTKLTYIPIAEVIARLNLLLGTENWGIVELDVHRDELSPGWVISFCKLYAIIDGVRTEKAAYGGSAVKEKRDGSGPVDLGDDFKSAASDALKKAAQQLGVGLELARSEEALELEDHERFVLSLEDQPKAESALLDKIEAWAKSLDPDSDALKEFKSWWAENVRVKIRSGLVTTEQAQLACERFGLTLEPA